MGYDACRHTLAFAINDGPFNVYFSGLPEEEMVPSAAGVSAAIRMPDPQVIIQLSDILVSGNELSVSCLGLSGDELASVKLNLESAVTVQRLESCIAEAVGMPVMDMRLLSP